MRWARSAPRAPCCLLGSLGENSGTGSNPGEGTHFLFRDSTADFPTSSMGWRDRWGTDGTRRWPGVLRGAACELGRGGSGGRPHHGTAVGCCSRGNPGAQAGTGRTLGPQDTAGPTWERAGTALCVECQPRTGRARGDTELDGAHPACGAGTAKRAPALTAGTVPHRFGGTVRSQYGNTGKNLRM